MSSELTFLTGSFFAQWTALPRIELVTKRNDDVIFQTTWNSPKKHIGNAFCDFLNQSSVLVVKEYGRCARWVDADFLDKEHYHFIILLEEDNYEEPNDILDNHITTEPVIDIDALKSHYNTQIENGKMEDIGSNDDELWDNI